MDACFDDLKVRAPRESDRDLIPVFVDGVGVEDRLIRTETHRWYATITPSGPGFECVVKRIDEQMVARLSDPLYERSKPKTDADREDNERRSKYRAKKAVRLFCKQIGVDHLLTLTTREDENTAEVMLQRFESFVRLYRRAVGLWEYVAVLESHPSNRKHLHIHVACLGKINVNIARKIWCVILGGAGMGNVDAKYIRSRTNNPHGVTYRIAGYISKYITKDTAVGFNKKRYWASRVKLPEVQRYLLDARTIEDALAEFTQRFGYSTEKGGEVVGYFAFPYKDGFWIDVIPDIESCPF